MLANLIIRFRILIIICVAVLVCGSVLLLPSLKIDVRFSDFFPKGDAQLDFYQAFISKMGSNDNLVFCAIEADKSVFDHSFLKKAHKFLLDCRKLPSVRKVNSITNSYHFHNSPFGIINRPYLHLDNTEKLESDSLRIVKDDYLTKRFFSSDYQYLSVIIELEKDLDMDQTDSALVQLDSVINLYGFKNTHLLGRKYMEVEYKRVVSKEVGNSLLLSTIFVVVVLGFLYRSFSGIILPVLSMLVALMIFYGFLALTDRSLGLLGNLFPTIMLIVGISDVIHILNKYSLEIQSGVDKRQAIKRTIKEIGFTTFLTSFTTAVGFLTLATSSMLAIKNFGIDAAVGVMIAYGVSIVFVPAIILTLGLKMPLKTQIFTKYWSSFSEKLFKLTIQKPERILAITFIIAGLALIGMFQIDTNNHQLTNIPKGHRLKSDYEVFEKNLGGARGFEMAVFCKNEFDLTTLQEIRTLHNYLDSLPELEKVFSPITFYYGISKTFEPGLPLFVLPESNEKLKRYVKKVNKSLRRYEWKLVDSTQTIGRISARMNDHGRLDVKALNSEISAWIKENLNTANLEFYFTGIDLLMDRGQELRIQNMVVGLAIAIFVVALVMGLVFRSTRIVIIVVFVNVLPLLILAGIMGFTGIELRGHSSTMFTIAFVIAVDDTIHFLSKFKIERQKGLSVSEAVRKTMQETLKAIIITSVILFGGFFVLVHSGFWDVYVVGLLVSTSLLFALIIDVFLMPVLIMRFIKDDIQHKSL